MKILWTAFFILLTSTSAWAVRFPLWSYKADSPQWNQTLRASLLSENKELLDSKPADAAEFCPNFKNLDQTQRVKFWIQLVAALAEKESNFVNSTKYTEGFNDNSGRRVVSRGLLQLSLESGRAYGCKIPNATDLHQANVNLLCGLKIMNRWVQRDGRIQGGGKNHWRGLARYWSPFRTSKFASLKANIRNTPICKNEYSEKQN